MNYEEVKLIIRYPDKQTVLCLLDTVNLKKNERTCIELVDMQGLTEQKASDRLRVSKRTVQNYRKRAYEKIGFALKNNNKAIDILGTR